MVVDSRLCGTFGSSVAERTNPLGGVGVGDPFCEDGRDVLRDCDFFFVEPPMMPRKKLRNPVSRSASVSLSVGGRERG